MNHILELNQLKLLINIYHGMSTAHNQYDMVCKFLYNGDGDWSYARDGNELELLKPIYYSTEQQLIFNELRKQYLTEK